MGKHNVEGANHGKSNCLTPLRRSRWSPRGAASLRCKVRVCTVGCTLSSSITKNEQLGGTAWEKNPTPDGIICKTQSEDL